MLYTSLLHNIAHDVVAAVSNLRQFVDVCKDAQSTTGSPRDLDLCTC